MSSKHRLALELLCDTIIQYASPTRGNPPDKIKERREERPTYTPLFFDVPCVNKVQINHDYPNQEWQTRLETLVGLVLREGFTRGQHKPAYFEFTLEICRYFLFDSFREFFFENQEELSKWNQVDAYKIKKIIEGYEIAQFAHIL